ncbi:MAG: polysaccharide deacetylase family protein, partial [Candidatus Eremiobacterota bacterium]
NVPRMRPQETTLEAPRGQTEPASSLWDWVHDHHQAAYFVGTGLLSALGAVLSGRGRRLTRFGLTWAGALALGSALDPLVNPYNNAYGHAWVRGPVERSAVALTFDDGPEPPYTERVLDILGEFGVKATFFLVGRQVERHPELARRILAEGHLMGNHTQNHLNLLKMTPAQGAREIEQGAATIERVTGVWPQWFRPPMGFRYPWNTRCARRLGQASVMWSLNPRDFEFPEPDVLVQRIVSAVGPGEIVLLHDGMRDQSNTVAALPALLRELKQRGLEPVRVDRLVS